MRQLYVVAHDIRSTFNVGSLLRTAEGLGVEKVFLTGYTPYPAHSGDQRLPHISQKLNKQISKTALGAEKLVSWEYIHDVRQVLKQLDEDNIQIVALEQTDRAVTLKEFSAKDKVAIVLGTEVSGLPKDILVAITDHALIPMYGRKESFNVVSAAAMALYDLRFR